MNPTQHMTLSAAMITVEDLVAQGHTSFKVFKELGLWNVIVNAVQAHRYYEVVTH